MRNDLYSLNFIGKSGNIQIDNTVVQIADDLLKTLIEQHPTTYDNVKEKIQMSECDSECNSEYNSELEVKVNTIGEIILNNAVYYLENNSEINDFYKKFKPVYYNHQQGHINISDVTLENILKHYTPKHVSKYNQIKKMVINNMFWSKKYNYYVDEHNVDELPQSQNVDDIGKLQYIITYSNTQKLFNILKKRNIHPSKYLFNNILSKLVYFIDIDQSKTPLSHIKKLFFEPIFKDIVIDEKTIKILLDYIKDDMIKMDDIQNTLDIVNYQYKIKNRKDGSQYQVGYVWHKITLGELKQELIKRYNSNNRKYE